MSRESTRGGRAPRRVVYVTTSLETVGPATALVELALRLDPLRYVPVFVQLDRTRGGWLEGRLSEHHIPVHSLGASGASALRPLIAVARGVQASVLHTRLIRADFLGRIAGRLAGVPVVVTNLCDVYTRHFAEQHGPRLGWWLRRLDQATLRFANHIVANAEVVRDDLLEHGIASADRVTTIVNGVDTARYRRDIADRAHARSALGVSHTDWVIGTVGRLSRKKRHDLLIDAFAVVAREVPAARLLIVGDGPLREALVARARDQGVARATIFAGARADVPALLSAMDLFAFPSEFEGCPNAVLEAMSARLPVVAADVPGTRDLVVSGHTGQLAPGGDTLALAAAMLSYRDHKRAEAAGEAGRLHVAGRYSLDVMASRFQALYDSWLEVART
jgi:glycosyltransferase involved in cell wall biosynthesis